MQTEGQGRGPLFSCDHDHIREYFDRRSEYRVSSLELVDQTAFILSDRGELTVEDSQRTSRTIAQAVRSNAITTSTFITICNTNCTIAIACLAYPPSQENPARGSPRNTDVLLIHRTDVGISVTPIPTLSGTTITSATWLGQQVLLGSLDGSCHALMCPSDVVPLSRPAEKVFDLQDFRSPITGMALMNDAEGGEGGRRCLLMATSDCLFCFEGQGGFGTVLSQYESMGSLMKAAVIEMDAGTNQLASRLAVRDSIMDVQVDVQQVAWLTQTMLLIVDLDVSPHCVEEGWDIMVQEATFHEVDIRDIVLPEYVVSLATTQWHVLLLQDDVDGLQGKVHIVSRISGSKVSEIAFPHALGSPLTIAQDSAHDSLHIAGSRAYVPLLEELASQRVWPEFLSLGRYKEGLQLIESGDASDVEDAAEMERARAALLVGWGDQLFKDGHYVEAAEKFGNISAAMVSVPGVPSFRQLALRFCCDRNTTDSQTDKALGLEKLLETKLAPYRRREQADANASALANWLLELLCDRINAATLDVTSAGDSVSPGSQAVLTALEAKLHDFIVSFFSQLPYNVLINILASFGRSKEMKLAARLAGSYHELLGYHLDLGEVHEALGVLDNLQGKQLYDSITDLMWADPEQTCTALRTYRGLRDVEPESLLTATSQFASSSTPAATRTVIMELLKWLIFERESRSREVQNLFFLFLAMEADPQHLSSFLDCSESQDPDCPGGYIFDAHYALRIAEQHGKTSACIRLMMRLNMLVDAIKLGVSYSERQSIIRDVYDEAQQRHLWLCVVELEVQKAAAEGRGPRECIKAIDTCVADSNGILAIEDVLKWFPRDASLQHYKDVLMHHMEAASSKVETMKKETIAATHMSGTLQQELNALQSMTASVSVDDICCSCTHKLGDRPKCGLPHKGAIPPFCVYPSGGKYHTSCAIYRHLMTSRDVQHNRRLKQILEDLNGIAVDAKNVTLRAGSTESVAKLQAELFKELEGGDPMNSDSVVDLIDIILGEENIAEADTWRVVP